MPRYMLQITMTDLSTIRLSDKGQYWEEEDFRMWCAAVGKWEFTGCPQEVLDILVGFWQTDIGHAFRNETEGSIKTVAVVPYPAEHVVIESHPGIPFNHAQWGVSLTGSNPEADDYIGCADRDSAFRIKALLDQLALEKLERELGNG